MDANLPGLAEKVARGKEQPMWEFLYSLRKLGSGRRPTEDVYVVPRLLGLAEETPTIMVRLNDEFWSLKRKQRVDLCQYINEYAKGCDVRLVASHFQQHRLYEEHREDICVSRDDITPPSGGPVSERVSEARVELDRDGREVQVLRWLAGEDSETLPYSSLYSRVTVGESRVRQYVSTLSELSLVAAVPAGQSKIVELLPAGREYLDQIDEELARQQTLEDSVTSHASYLQNAVSTQQSLGGGMEGDGPDKDRQRLPDLHEVSELSRWDAVASSASAPENGVGVVDYPVRKQGDRGSPRWFYDYGRDQLVVGAEYDNPMQYWVCIARALVSPRTWHAVLDNGSRLDEADKFSEFFSDYRSSTVCTYLQLFKE